MKNKRHEHSDNPYYISMNSAITELQCVHAHLWREGMITTETKDFLYRQTQTCRSKAVDLYYERRKDETSNTQDPEGAHAHQSGS